MGSTAPSGGGWWIGSVAVAGALLGMGALVLQLALPGDPIRWDCGVVGRAECFVPPTVALVAGLIGGGFLGSRVPRMGRGMRTGFGAAIGAVIGASLGGSAGLFIEVSGEDWPSGLAAFVTGAILGGVVGAVVGGLAGRGPPMSDR